MKLLILSIALIPAALFVALLFFSIQAGINEGKLIDFCNDLEVGQDKQQIISSAETLGGSRIHPNSRGKNKLMIISTGYFYATCHIEFKNEILTKKELGIS